MESFVLVPMAYRDEKDQISLALTWKNLENTILSEKINSGNMLKTTELYILKWYIYVIEIFKHHGSPEEGIINYAMIREVFMR